MARKFKRRPNNSGTTYKLSGNRRKPFVASVTTGYDVLTGRQIQKPIGYFETEEEALNELALFQMKRNKNFSDDSFSPTFAEIWNKIFNEDLSHLAENTKSGYRTGFNHLKPVHNTKIKTATLFHLQPIFDDIMKDGVGKGKIETMIVVLKHIYKYAMRYEFVEKDYSSLISYKIDKSRTTKKIPFSDADLIWLFENDYDDGVKAILIMCYAGLRPSELCLIEKENVFIDDRYMVGGIKTEAGMNRVLPIHECLVPHIEHFLKKNKNKYLFTWNDKETNYSNFRLTIFHKIKQNLSAGVTPHSGRHTFATLAHRYKLDSLVVKRIIGHSSKDITLDIYTHKTNEELISEINKIKTPC